MTDNNNEAPSLSFFQKAKNEITHFGHGMLCAVADLMHTHQHSTARAVGVGVVTYAMAEKLGNPVMTTLATTAAMVLSYNLNEKDENSELYQLRAYPMDRAGASQINMRSGLLTAMHIGMAVTGLVQDHPNYTQEAKDLITESGFKLFTLYYLGKAMYDQHRGKYERAAKDEKALRIIRQNQRKYG